MAEEMDIMEPPVEEDQGGGPGPKQVPPQTGPVLKDTDRQRLDGIVQKMIQNKETDENIKAVVSDFKGKYGQKTAATPTPAPPPEHQLIHTPLQDIRHLKEMSEKPVESRTTVLDPLSGSSTTEWDQADVARNRQFSDQYEAGVNNLATQWGTDPKATKQVLNDFPDETRDETIKENTQLYNRNPVLYSRLKDANDIVKAISKSGPNGVYNANLFNHLQQSSNYEELQHHIAAQQELISEAGLGSEYMEKLKNTQAPLINTLDPGLHLQYWNSEDHKLGLSESQYAGLETLKMFQPGRFQEVMNILKENRGLEQGGEPRPEGQGKRGYEYDRGVENVLFQLEQQGRQNTARYIDQQNIEVGKQIAGLKDQYQSRINAAKDPVEQKRIFDEFQNHPLIQEANKLDEGQQALQYAQSEDERRFPLNYADQATRLAKDAMDHTSGIMGTAGKFLGNVVTGAGQSSDNTMRFIKNSFINMLGTDEMQAVQHAKNIGHQSLTELANYEPTSFTGTQSPLLISNGLKSKVQGVFDENGLSDSDKEQKAINLIRANPDEIKINPQAGQQNLTGKAMAFQAANTIGQILGIADQSLLMGGLFGSAGKAQQMANAIVPMYTSTQNQLYEQALARGDEKPLLKSSMDAAIISLASMINPDIKIVKGMVGAETGIGKMIAGVDESAWNKVLSENKPLVDRMIAGTKATAKQLGLANLQYGLIVPTAQYLVHKNVFNENPNLGDMIKDGIIQTNITMALPALAHGIWGGINADKVNPASKYAIVEAGLHHQENIDLINSQVERGQITPEKADKIKEVIKQTGQILKDTEMTKTDGTPMNEKEVADVVYNQLRKKVLEGKLKNAADPQKPIIEDRIHDINQQISELHTSESDKQKNELNQMLTDNMDKIIAKQPEMESAIKDAVKRNEPEDVFKLIHDQASETKSEEGKEVSLRPDAEDVFGKGVVQKAFDLHNNKTKTNESKTEANAQAEGQIKNPEGAENNQAVVGAAPSLYSGPISEKGKAAIKEANDRKKEVEDAGFDFLAQEDDGGPYNKNSQYSSDEVPIGSVGLKQEEHGKGLGTLGYILKGEEYLKKGRHLVSDAPHIPEARTNQAEGVWKNLVNLGLATETSQGSYRYGGEREQSEDSGQKQPQNTGQEKANPVTSEELPFGDLPVGIAHHLQEQRAAAELNVLPPERGEGITPEQSIQRGKELISEGVNPDQVVADFKKDKRLSSEDMAVVRARYNELAQKTNKAYDQHGEGSPEAKAAFTAERSWYNDAVKPMQTEWSKIGTAQQGVVDLDTGSVTALKRAFAERSGKDLTPEQSAKAKEMADNVKELNGKIEKLQKQLDEAHKNKGSKGGIKQTGKALADKIRKAKLHRPDTFSVGNPASLVWDSAVELTAKSVEAGASIADAISKGIEHIKASDWYKGLKPEEQKKAENQFADWNNEQANEKIDLAAHFANKTDNNFTTGEAKAIWDHAKTVIDSGKSDFHEVVKQVAMDTGLTAEQVRRAIAEPKGAKVITDKMYAEMYRKRQIQEQAQMWVKTADQSKAKKFWNNLVKIPSAIVTFGHGSVAPITHVGADLYRPSNWSKYFKFMLDSYKYSFGGVTDAGKARYEKAMTDMVNDPMYIPAKRSGLKIDPTDLSGDDYSKYQSVLGGIAKMGERGFNAMKPYRLEEWKKIYNGLSDQAKGDPDVIKAISHMVNLSSGTTDAKIPQGTDVVFFAPKLVVSQYQRIFSEPAKAVNTFVNWKASTSADKLQAKMVARHAGEMVSTYIGLLVANQVVLNMSGSKHKINFTNPLDSDWMKFKVMGKSVDASGGMNSALRFVGSLGEEALRANGIVKTDEKSKPGDVEGNKILQQLTNKLSPFAGDVKELVSGTDMMGNPLPWSAVKPAAGKEKQDWVDYLTTKLPIPLAEGFKTFTDAAKENGMSRPTLNNYLEGILVGVLTGSTGAKISPDNSLNPKTKQGGRPSSGSRR